MNFILYNGSACRHRGTGRERQGGIKRGIIRRDKGREGGPDGGREHCMGTR